MGRVLVSVFIFLVLMVLVPRTFAEPPGNSGPARPDLDQVVQIGARVGDELLGTLQQNLRSAMMSGGPVHAIAFCSENARQLTDGVALGIAGGVRATRVSDRPRNPRNTPDDLDREALGYFTEAIVSRGKMPAHYTIKDPSRNEHRYYRPLTIAPLCLTCHGDRELMPEEVKEVIASRYPRDQAYGYHEGELRGVLRVTIPAALVTESEAR